MKSLQNNLCQSPVALNVEHLRPIKLHLLDRPSFDTTGYDDLYSSLGTDWPMES